MKNTKTNRAKKNSFLAIAVVTAILFCFTACEEDSGGGGGGGGGSKPDYTGTDIADFATWLADQPDNTPETAYLVKLNVDNLGGYSYTAGSVGKVLRDNSTKYVSLDLSGSTITSIWEAFSDCTSLTGVTIPNSVTSIGSEAFRNCTNLASVTFQGTITSSNFNSFTPFPGDLRSKYLASGGGMGTYKRSGAGTTASPYTWTKQ